MIRKMSWSSDEDYGRFHLLVFNTMGNAKRLPQYSIFRNIKSWTCHLAGFLSVQYYIFLSWILPMMVGSIVKKNWSGLYFTEECTYDKTMHRSVIMISRNGPKKVRGMTWGYSLFHWKQNNCIDTDGHFWAFYWDDLFWALWKGVPPSVRYRYVAKINFNVDEYHLIASHFSAFCLCSPVFSCYSFLKCVV